MNKWLLLLLCLCFSARAEQPLTSLTGETIALDDSTPVHLVFLICGPLTAARGRISLLPACPCLTAKSIASFGSSPGSMSQMRSCASFSRPCPPIGLW